MLSSVVSTWMIEHLRNLEISGTFQMNMGLPAIKVFLEFQCLLNPQNAHAGA